MPRGYLKHQERDCGKKRARGGSSNRTKKPRHENRRGRKRGERLKVKAMRHVDTAPRWKDDLPFAVLEGLSDHVDQLESKKGANYSGYHEMGPRLISTPENRAKMQKMEKCAICLDEKHTLKLMKNCLHPSACYDCLREMFVVQAQKNIWNYPLKCFHPSCNRLVGAPQLKKYNFIRSEEELKKHYRFSVLGKSYQGSQQVLHCPSCDHPRYFDPKRFHRKNQLEFKFKCKACKTRYYINSDGKTTERSTIFAIESIKSDRMGRNDGWCRCPKCKMIISKGDGCDHIACPCGQHFYFSEWKESSYKPGEAHREANIFSVAESLNLL